LLEECATEYLATKAVQAAGYSPGIAKYSNAMDSFYEVARQVGGLSAVQDAYLNSGAGQFQQTFDAAKGAGAWQFFVDSMNSGDNANAKAILTQGTRGTVFDKKMMVLSNIVDATWITDEELNQFQQGWGELLIEEKKICRPRFQLIIDHATVMRDSRKTTLESTMAS
jgi:hypothetical protein